MSNQFSHQLNPEVTSVMLEYGNSMDSFVVADGLFPAVPVCSKSFQYRKFDEAQAYRQTNSYVGRKSQVHEIDDLTSDLITESVTNYALDYPLPIDDLEQAACTGSAGVTFNIKAQYARAIVHELWLGRERRAIDAVFTSSLWPTANKVDLAGSEFNRTDTDASDPLVVLGDLIASARQKYNIAVMSLQTFLKIARNVSFLGNVDARGVAGKAGIAAMLGLDEILIADARFNFADEGESVDIQPLVGTSIVLANVNKGFTMTESPRSTFGFTAKRKSLQAFEHGSFKHGAYGSLYLRGAYSEKQVVTDYSQGYLLENVVL